MKGYSPSCGSVSIFNQLCRTIFWCLGCSKQPGQIIEYIFIETTGTDQFQGLHREVFELCFELVLKIVDEERTEVCSVK
jgi:hypothetical protein